MESKAGALGYFGDARRAACGTDLLDRVTALGTLVLRKLGGDRAGEMAINRFLSGPSVCVREMLQTLSARTVAGCAGRHILAVQDTTEINFAGRDAGRVGFGPGGDGVCDGFFIHALIAVDIDTSAVLGLLDAQIWTRPPSEAARPRRQREFEKKESFRWQWGAERAAALLIDAASVCCAADRESDIYACFAGRPEATALIVRAAQDRAVESGARLFASLADTPELGRVQVELAPRRPGERKRVASVALRAREVTIMRPATNLGRSDPATVVLNLVEAREVGEAPDGRPLLWRLLTSAKVETAEAAGEIVRRYRLRWRIEEVFRALKSDGMRIEELQVRYVDRMFKLAVVGMAGATRTIQLVDARDGSPRPASDVIDQSLMPVAAAISPTLEGKTERQKNPHPVFSLAWLAWIIGRLGGWNCYYKPPGPKTMRDGWAAFSRMAAGYAIAKSTPTPA